MTKWIAVVALVVGLCAAGIAGDNACDLKKVEKAKVCGACKTIDPKLDDKGQCCGAAPADADVCVKDAFQCSTCKKLQKDSKPCCKDGKIDKLTVKALVVLKCEGCGAAGDKEGPCAKEECSKAGKQIKKTCSKSGEFPHGGS